MIARLARAGAMAALVLGALTLIGATVLDEAFGVEVLFITPKADEAVRADREFWERGDPVAEIYGTPADQPARVLFPDADRIVRPDEDPTLVLLKVDKQAGENPFQVKMLWFFAWRAAIAFGLAALVFIGLAAFASRRASRAVA